MRKRSKTFAIEDMKSADPVSSSRNPSRRLLNTLFFKKNRKILGSKSKIDLRYPIK